MQPEDCKLHDRRRAKFDTCAPSGSMRGSDSSLGAIRIYHSNADTLVGLPTSSGLTIGFPGTQVKNSQFSPQADEPRAAQTKKHGRWKLVPWSVLCSALHLWIPGSPQLSLNESGGVSLGSEIRIHVHE
jgi:hypothetical protein